MIDLICLTPDMVGKVKVKVLGGFCLQRIDVGAWLTLFVISLCGWLAGGRRRRGGGRGISTPFMMLINFGFIPSVECACDVEEGRCIPPSGLGSVGPRRVSQVGFLRQAFEVYPAKAVGGSE